MGNPMDQLLKQAEVTLYFEAVGKNDQGETLYRMIPFSEVSVGPTGGGETLYKMPLPPQSVLGDKFDQVYRIVLKPGGPDLDGVNFFGGI